MSGTNKIMNAIRYVLPSPFSIGIILTFIVFSLAILFKIPDNIGYSSYGITLLEYWNKGFWELLQFAMQMVLMLLLGHVIAISDLANKIINKLISPIDSTSKAALFATFFTILVSLFNWGLGLIFGAIIARKIGEKFQKDNKPLNYPLIAACGYVGLMVWHGGLSGSAPLKVADKGHFYENLIGVISIDKTIFSSMNIVVMIMLLIIIPLLMWWIGRKGNQKVVSISFIKEKHITEDEVIGAEKIDKSKVFGMTLGTVFVLWSIYLMIKGDGLNFINTNYINFLLFGLAILLHQNIRNFLLAAEEAVVGTLGIIIQFPIYAGIMGIMKYSELTSNFTDVFISISNSTTLPIFSMLSSGLVNIFVPSGGGQWAVQGSIIIESAQQLGVSVEKNIMALAYGDQLTNMLQPFWALPLLGITKLKAQDIFPYTLILFLAGLVIFSTALLIF